MALLLAALVLGGCSPSAEDAGLLASRSAHGGLCSAGPCLDELVVDADGRWTRRDEGGTTGSGRLRSNDLAELRSAVDASETPSGAAPTPGCGSASDGQEVVYVWMRAGVRLDTTACTPSAPPVVDRLEALAARLR